MKDQVTTIEQWERLKKCGVPAEKASMCRVKDPNENDYNLAVHDECCYEMAGLEPIPAYTVADLMGKMLPNMIQNTHNTFVLAVEGVVGGGWISYYAPVFIDLEADNIGKERGSDLVELLCNRIEWIVSNGYKLNL